MFVFFPNHLLPLLSSNLMPLLFSQLLLLLLPLYTVHLPSLFYSHLLLLPASICYISLLPSAASLSLPHTCCLSLSPLHPVTSFAWSNIESPNPHIPRDFLPHSTPCPSPSSHPYLHPPPPLTPVYTLPPPPLFRPPLPLLHLLLPPPTHPSLLLHLPSSSLLFLSSLPPLLLSLFILILPCHFPSPFFYFSSFLYQLFLCFIFPHLSSTP